MSEKIKVAVIGSGNLGTDLADVALDLTRKHGAPT
jgi:acetaldehyde dehydrogenase (acetylating)